MKKYLYVLLLFSAILSCKKKHHEDPAPARADMRPKVTYMRDVRLYNQFYAANNFFSLHDSVFVTDKADDFDLCYSTIALGTPLQNYYVIGSPADKTYTDKAYTGLTSANATAFYEVPASFTYAHFDTLLYGSGLHDFVENNCSIIYSNINIQLAQAMRSDMYGWAPDEIYAFKTQAGEYGLLKILAVPTGSSTETDPTKRDGVLRLDIKFQKNKTSIL